MNTNIIGVLAFQGDVIEHMEAARIASDNLRLNIKVIPVRANNSLDKLDGLIIPGGESTTLYRLCAKEKMWKRIKQIRNIFGTCAGAIMLAKTVKHKTKDQKSLELMNITIDRNAYGRQTESFEKEVITKIGKVKVVFIRAPKILKIGFNVKKIAVNNQEVIACEQKTQNNYYLATCFHPELTSTLFHEYFLKNIYL